MKKSKFSNISTKSNDTQNQSSKTKRKFFKTFGFASLAVLMGTAGIFAFAPLGASPSVASANEMVDQINTKADGDNIKYAPSPLGLDPENDPVIYTTESGLEIKFGGLSVNNSSTSWRLTGYPYFTMGTYSGYAVNWVIIGRNTNDDVFLNQLTYHLFSNWKTNNSKHSATYENKGYYFFKDHYEAVTPAGSAINGVVTSKSYVADVTKVTKTVVGNDEIPSGCVLAISECCLGYSYFNCTSAASNTHLAAGSQNFSSRYRYRSSSGTSSDSGTVNWTASTNAGTLYTNVSNLYSSTLGLTTAQQNMIQGQKLNTIYYNNGTAIMETYNTDGNTLHKFFPLAGCKQTYDVSGTPLPNNPGDENFIISTYLNSNTLRQSYQIGTTSSVIYWLRSAEGCNTQASCAIGKNNSDASGIIDGYWARWNFGVRPACVVKLG